MNRSPSGFSLSKAIEGFLQHKATQALSPHTFQSYEQHLWDLVKHTGDVDVEHLTTPGLRAYPAWLRPEYKPRRLSGSDRPLAPKTVPNV